MYKTSLSNLAGRTSRILEEAFIWVILLFIIIYCYFIRSNNLRNSFSRDYIRNQIRNDVNSPCLVLACFFDSMIDWFVTWLCIGKPMATPGGLFKYTFKSLLVTWWRQTGGPSYNCRWLTGSPEAHCLHYKYFRTQNALNASAVYTKRAELCADPQGVLELITAMQSTCCRPQCSRVAQRKRAGPITQRSMDRNHPLLVLFYLLTVRRFK